MTRNVAVAAMLAMATFLLVGCASDHLPRQSGFLKNYSQLRQEQAPDGGTRLVYRNPALVSGNYTALWLDPVRYYPEPQPNEHVSAASLNEIRTYIDQSLRQKLSQHVKVVDQAGPGVIRVGVAITAVGAETQALKAYQYIPIALVMTGARAAVEGGLPEDASIAIEGQAIDSVTGQLLYASMRGGTGERVRAAAQGQGSVQLRDLKPLIDQWLDNISIDVNKVIR